MEHSCQRCNSVVKDSAPFCPNCGAPQIRVKVPDPEWQSAPRVSETFAAPSAAIPQPPASWPRLAESARQLAVKTAAVAGLWAAILGMVPLRGFIVIVLPVAGYFSVWLYRRRTRIANVSTREGFSLGALTGLFASAISLVLVGLSTLVVHGESELRETLIQSIHQAQSHATDPQSQEVYQYLLSPQGMLLMMVLGAAFLVVFFVVLGGLGGAVSASMSRKTRSE